MRPFMTSLLITVLSVSAFATDYTYTITDGYFDTLTLENSESLLMTGGGGDLLEGKGSSVLDIRNTSPLIFGSMSSGGIAALTLSDSSFLNFSGGDVWHLNIDSNAAATLSGGRIDFLQITSTTTISNPHVTMVCATHYLEDVPNVDMDRLKGTWLDGSSFSIWLVDDASYQNIEFIPEPTTLFLLAVGGILIRKK